MRIRLTAPGAAVALLGACSDPTVPDLNNPGRADYENITTRAQIQGLASGMLDGDRDAHGPQITYSEIIARNLFRIDPAEQRYTTGLLSANGPTNSDFLGNSTWTIPYSTIRQGRVLNAGITAATAVTPTPLSDAEKAATRGFSYTLIGLQYLRVWETRGSRGAPIQGEEGVDSLPPISCEEPLLAYASAVLDSGATELTTAAATAMPFALPTGFAGFSTANAAAGTDFLAFNRGLKAKVEMYRGFLPLGAAQNPATAPVVAALNAALTATDASFYNPVGTRAALDFGVYHTYSTASGENQNPLVDVGVFRVNPKVITEGAEPGDVRIAAKVDTSASNTNRSFGTGASAISSRFTIRSPASANDRLALLKNGELVLNRALILWGLNRDAEALALVNIVRAGAGLAPRTAGEFATRRALLLGILKEKRYELLFESPARHVDYRTLGILSDLGLERNLPVSVNSSRFPIPNNEAVARNGNITCVP
jgi:hypothetical protein